MEKDHFLDRPTEIMYRNNVPNGAKVFICTKQMQPYAKTLKDLNLITITGNLTSTATHSRGQKVQGEEILTDKYGNYILDSNNNLIKKEAKGRCTYLVTQDSTAILTKDGYKYLEIFEDIDGKYKYKILTEDQIIGKYKLVALFKLNPEFEFRIPICNFKYFNTIDDLKKEAKTIDITKATLYNGFIILEMNNYKIKIMDIYAEWGYDNKIKISYTDFIEHLSNNYQPSNNTTYSFNKTYDLEFVSFIAEEY
jgi:hypothetical protein